MAPYSCSVPGWEIWSWSVRISTEAVTVHQVDKAASDMRSENRVATTCDAVVVQLNLKLSDHRVWESLTSLVGQFAFLQMFQKTMMQVLIRYLKCGILCPPNIVIVRIMAGIGMIWVVGENQRQVLSHRWAAAKLVTALCWQYSRSAIVAVSTNATALQLQLFPWQCFLPFREVQRLFPLGPFLGGHKIFQLKGKNKSLVIFILFAV